MTSAADTMVITPRDLWTLFEPIHSVTYFSPEALAAFEEAGLKGFWDGYFAGRAAPLGPAEPATVTAAFCSYAPAMVARSVPSVWRTVTPEQALELRLTGARAALARLLAGHEERIEEAAGLLTVPATAPDCAGRALAAANTALPWPTAPLERLWHATTVLREHRGDGYVAAQIAADLDGCEILVLRTGIDLPRSELQPYRGWTDAEWDAATARLTERGLLAADGRATEEGTRLHTSVEEATETAAARPWARAGDLTRLSEALIPLSDAVAATLRFPNPIGLPERSHR
ncbi:hypothetical protein ACFVIM_16845 [Streptomyces sp. NPDC057638]|uniref:SCO6745 family protein n=1 Tax=Streptomyces sp. NPDC057638 TaxID=3346190 RepID=UPI0036861B79